VKSEHESDQSKSTKVSSQDKSQPKQKVSCSEEKVKTSSDNCDVTITEDKSVQEKEVIKISSQILPSQSVDTNLTIDEDNSCQQQRNNSCQQQQNNSCQQQQKLAELSTCSTDHKPEFELNENVEKTIKESTECLAQPSIIVEKCRKVSESIDKTSKLTFVNDEDDGPSYSGI